MVICNNPTNWPEQWVITDAMEKGKVPLGVFIKIIHRRKAWLGEHNIDGTELALIAVTSFAHSCLFPARRYAADLNYIRLRVHSTHNS